MLGTAAKLKINIVGFALTYLLLLGLKRGVGRYYPKRFKQAINRVHSKESFQAAACPSMPHISRAYADADADDDSPPAKKPKEALCIASSVEYMTLHTYDIRRV